MLSLSVLCGVYLLTKGTMALSSLFATAGLIVPVIACSFLYDELVEWYQWIALVCFMLGSYFLSVSSKKTYGKFSFSQLLVLIASLLINGTTMLMQKMFGEEVKGGNVSFFSFVSFLSGLVLVGLVWLVIALLKKCTQTKKQVQDDQKFSLYPQTKMQGKLPKDSYLCGFCLAFAVFLINQLITISTPMIQAIILFAVTCGGATIISALVGAIIYKEKVTVNTIIGLVLGIGSLILLKV
jgi:drug/metabolite transporter (DMT)-like permease